MWLNVSGMQQLLLFQNLILTVEYIKVIKISFFLTSALHRQMQSLSHGCHLVSFKAKHSSFLQLALRRHGCDFQTFSHLCSFVSVDTPFCWCLGFTCAWNPAQYPAVVKAVQRAGSFPPLTGHCSLNSALGWTGFSCLQHHWLMLVLHLLISVVFHRSGRDFNNPLGLEVLKPHLPRVAKWVSAVLHYCVSSRFPPEKQPFIGTNLRFQRTTS